jgi:two-component system, cell cycle sensor histidine kinase and response regulator CckA
MQLTPYVLLHLLSAALLGGLGVYCWFNRNGPATATLSRLMLLCAGLALCYAFDLASSSLPEKIFWMKGRFLFLAVIPVLWLVMIVRYVGQETFLNRRRLAALFTVPILTVIMAWTSGFHTLFRYNFRLDSSGPFPVLLWQSGPWYWLHLCYSYALFTASVALLLLSLRNAQAFYRRRSLMIIGGAFLPVLADAVFHTGIPVLPGYILSTTILFLSGLLIVWALFHNTALNVVPIARSTVLEKMSDIMIVLDGLERIVDFNEAAQKAFDLQPARSIGKPLEVLLKRWPALLDHCRRAQCAKDEVVIGAGPDRQFYDLSITAIKNRRDELTGRVIILRDMTDHKRAEEEHQRLQERLRRAEKMEALGTLAGGVAHDLNNILGGIVGYPDLILADLPSDSPLKEELLIIKNSGQRAAAVVQDLLTLTRRGVITTEVLSLNDVISEYLETPEQQKLRSFHPDVRFETRLDEGLLPVKGSRVHLAKTVMNLLVNAAEAMPEGGGATVSTRNVFLEKPVRGYDDVQAGEYAALIVSDTGQGICADDLGTIFEPFCTRKTMGKSGTGLGLSVVWGTVQDHNGYIDVQSEEGRGTTFSLYFPVTKESLTEKRPPVPLERYMGKGETILVVDDVKEQRELAVAMLGKLNYRAASVSSGEEAVEYVKARQVDLLVLDMIMDPGIDGLETYRRILKIHPLQKAVIVSGFSETERVRQAREMGSGVYLRKPYALESLGLAVRRELDIA